MSDYVPGWTFDPSLPTIPEEEPCCDLCGRRLTDIVGDDEMLPIRHRATPRRGRAGVNTREMGAACPRNRDHLMTIVYRLQREAAGLDPPANPYGFRWVGHRLVATSMHRHRSMA